MNNSIYQIARKELNSFFSSPVAFLFLGVFLLINLFIFFWVEAFFARNIADVRPLFEWMPLLLIFLVSALTMRMWSEERRMGTLEFLFTLPVSTLNLVLGKFLACAVLVAVALILTLPLPLTVSFLGVLDWGPVFGAYLASLLLAAVYISIGLCVSARTDSQIVSLIVTSLICMVFYLIGSDVVTPLVGNQGSEFMKLLGTGSRFESITRGVIDLRDLYYYLSLTGVFIAFNILALEKIRWTSEPTKSHRTWKTVTALLALNLLSVNLWLQRIPTARVDLTEGNIYSISPATREYLAQLQEPLLIRGYFSDRTHPLLAPLVPQLRDLIQEYEIAGNGKVQAEFIDPRENPELEEEASNKYGIKPVPFQIADKYQQSLVNSYFDILIQYGDEFEILNFQKLIEVKVMSETNIDVKLRNPEYDITRSIKKVLYGFQGVDHLFALLSEPVQYLGYVSNNAILPEKLQEYKGFLLNALSELKESSNGKLEFSFQDPGSTDSDIAKNIAEEYGFRPMVTGLFDANPFYFYGLLKQGNQVVQVPLSTTLSKESAKQSVEAALKRFSSGFIKTVALHLPPAPAQNPMMMQMGMPPQGGKQFRLLREKLEETYKIVDTNLEDGSVPEQADILLLLSPTDLSETQLFAVDQFLMKGGTVVAGTSPYSITRSRSGMSASKINSGLEGWLKHQGINVDSKMVLDTQNEMYPVPVRRNLGAFQVEEIRLIPYPYFVDVRVDGSNEDSGLLSGIQQVTLNWPSPVTLALEDSAPRKGFTLLHSSDSAWLSDSSNITPNFETFGELGFAPSGEQKSYPLAAVLEGKFESYFEGKDSPLLKEKEAEEEPAQPSGESARTPEEDKGVFSGVIERSPDSARLIVFGSNEFIADQTLNISASGGGSRFLNSIQLLENSIDWSLEDRGLLTIRSRGHFSRTLFPMDRSWQLICEYLNYGLALLGLLVVFITFKSIRSGVSARYSTILQAQGA